VETPSPETSLGGVHVGSIERRKGLTYSLWDGIFGSGMMALADTFAVAAAVSLKSPLMAIALLGSLPLLISSLLQPVLPAIINPARGRRYYVVRAVAMQAVFIMLAGLTGFFGPPAATWLFLGAFMLYGSAGNSVSCLWGAWMSDLIPPAVRGRHFAWRGRIFAAVQLSFALTAGYLSRHYTSDNTPWVLFTIVFGSAGLLRLGSSLVLSRQYEPPLEHTEKSNAPFVLTKPFIVFLAGNALLNGAASMAGPFFNVWFLRDLKFDYLTLSIATSCTVLGSILALPLWGRLADSAGSQRVMQIAAFMCALVPLPYIFAQHAYAIWFFNFYSGVAWSGYGLCSFNYLLAAAGKERPEKAISWSIAVTGITIFLFSLLGGYLAPRLPVLWEYQLRSIFGLSGLLRLLVVLFVFRMLGKFDFKFDLHVLHLFDQVPGLRVGMEIVSVGVDFVRRPLMKLRK
jgi:MFS family permease